MVWVWVLHFPMFSWHPENHQRTPSQPGGSSRKATSIAAWGSGTRTKDGLSWKWPGKALKLMVFRGYPSWKLTVCIYYICIYVNVYVTTNHVGELWFIDAACPVMSTWAASNVCKVLFKTISGESQLSVMFVTYLGSPAAIIHPGMDGNGPFPENPSDV